MSELVLGDLKFAEGSDLGKWDELQSGMVWTTISTGVKLVLGKHTTGLGFDRRA